MCLLDAASGAVIAEYRPLQRVWVELGADGSRAHGPAMRMRLLADSHPAVAEAIRQGKDADLEGAGAAPTAAAAAAAERQGCGTLPRGHPRGSYRPPGLGLGRVPPPGFPAPALAAAEAAAAAAAEPSARPQEQQQEPAGAWPGPEAGGAGPAPEPRAGLLHLEAPRTAVQEALAARGSGCRAAFTADAVAAAARRLRARASRYALRAAEGDPAGDCARLWAGRAASCRTQLAQLEALVAAARGSE